VHPARVEVDAEVARIKRRDVVQAVAWRGAPEVGARRLV